MSRLTRRKFMRQTGAGVLGATAISVAPAAQAARANDKLVAALIGCGGQGPGVAGGVKGTGNVEIA